MSAANDGARPSPVREDSGITSHGVTPAAWVRPGMSVRIADNWHPILAVDESSDAELTFMLIDTDPDHWVPFIRMDWLNVRENDGHTYTDD